MSNFETLGLCSALLKVTKKLGFKEPTPIQRDAIPLVVEGRDVMGLAQTGTGKTAAFGLPLVHHLLVNHEKASAKCTRALILAPTRELADQIAKNIRSYADGTSLSIQFVVGGASLHGQSRRLAKGCDCLIATPGRLIDLIERGALKLDETRFLVLDEADQMLDLGFIHSLRKIASLLAEPRQTLLFSATMPKQMNELAGSYLTNPERIEVSPVGSTAEKVRQEVHFLDGGEKPSRLEACLNENSDGLSIVFTRTKNGAEKLMIRLSKLGFEVQSVHGNKNQSQRDRAIRQFKAGKVRILVATDVAARGIDIPGVSYVYNYDLPEVPENYVHRIGRTARAGREGKAISFCSPTDAHLLFSIERLIKMEVETVSGERPDFKKARSQKGRRGGYQGKRNSSAKSGPKKRFNNKKEPFDKSSSGEGGQQKKQTNASSRKNGNANSPRRNRNNRRKPVAA